MQNKVSPTHPKVAGEPEKLGDGFEDTEGHGLRFVSEPGETGERPSLRVQEDDEEDTEGHVGARWINAEPKATQPPQVQEVKGTADGDHRL